jgi:hypothetical protein
MQADSIIPKSGNVQAWDRFAYTMNNPIRYNDPSGHCTGDPYELKNPDRACWKMYFTMQKRFPGVSINGQDFNYRELSKIYLSLFMAEMPYGQGSFEKVYGKITIKAFNLPAEGIAIPWGELILLDKSIFYDLNGNLKTTTQILFGIIHEIAHKLDFKGGHPYFSDSFRAFFNKGDCGNNSGILGCVSNSARISYKLLNIGGGFGYKPTGETSWWGGMASVEDFAESYASYIIHTYWDRGFNSYIDQEREHFIANLVDIISEDIK